MRPAPPTAMKPAKELCDGSVINRNASCYQEQTFVRHEIGLLDMKPAYLGEHVRFESDTHAVEYEYRKSDQEHYQCDDLQRL